MYGSTFLPENKQKKKWNWNDRDKKKIQVGNQNYDFLSLNSETWSHNYKIESQKYDLYWIIYSLSSHNCEKKSNILLTISCFYLFNPKCIYISHIFDLLTQNNVKSFN